MSFDAVFAPRALRRWAPLAFAVLVLASEPSPKFAFAGPSPAPQPAIRVLAAWIRWLPAGLPAAGYLTLANVGEEAISLDGASSPSYREVSIHRSVTKGANVQMLPVKAITLAPHTTLDFESGGYHLMLMQPAASADSAGKIMITLHFSGGQTLTVPFEIRKNPDSAQTPQRPAG